MVDDVDLKLAAMGRDATIVSGPLSFDAFIPVCVPKTSSALNW